MTLTEWPRSIVAGCLAFSDRIADAIRTDSKTKTPPAPLPVHPEEQNMDNAPFRHLLGKVRDAKIGGHASWCAQSTGEKVAVALVLKRPDWLASMDYTLAKAIDRIDPLCGCGLFPWSRAR